MWQYFKNLKEKPLPRKIEFKYHKLVHFSFQFSHKYNFEFFSGMKIPAIPLQFMRETPQAYLLTFAMFLAGAVQKYVFLPQLCITYSLFISWSTHWCCWWYRSWNIQLVSPSLSSISIHKGHWLASTHVSDTYIALYFGLDHHLLQKYHH